MISAQDFVEAARARGFDLYAGVPCSFLTPFINYVISDASLRYLSCANEGDAVAVGAGWALAGRRAVVMMQNSGLGNAVSPLTSLTWTFRLPQLLIITWRGEPGITDEPQHQLMGPITPALLEKMEIAWEFFPDEQAKVAAALDRALAHMRDVQRPYALLMRKGTVSDHALAGSGAPAPRTGARPQGLPPSGHAPALSRTDALRHLIHATPLARSVLVATTGFTGRELWALDDRANQLYMVGSMGCAPGVGLGLALAQPERQVIVVDGDGAALMRLGLFATLGAYGPSNLVHLLLDNHAHDSTGAQATVSRGVSFAAIAAACGYAEAIEGDRLELIDRLLASPGEAVGPRFGRLLIRPGAPAKLPRPSVTPEAVARRLTAHLAAQDAA